MSTDQMTTVMCNIREVSQSDKPTEDDHLTLQSPTLLVCWSPSAHCFGVPALIFAVFVKSERSQEPCFLAPVFKTALVNPLYATRPAPKGRRTK